jgi:hypothetical protein
LPDATTIAPGKRKKTFLYLELLTIHLLGRLVLLARTLLLLSPFACLAAPARNDIESIESNIQTCVVFS